MWLVLNIGDNRAPAIMDGKLLPTQYAGTCYKYVCTVSVKGAADNSSQKLSYKFTFRSTTDTFKYF
jgi:hypothetical protein